MRSPGKSWFLSVAGMFMLCSMAILPAELEAQRRGGPGNDRGRRKMQDGMEEMQKQQAKRQFERLCSYLELVKKQKKKADKLFKDMQKKTEKVIRDLRKGKLDRTEADEKRIKTIKDYRDKFKDLLSQEQKEKYEKLRETGLKPEN